MATIKRFPRLEHPKISGKIRGQVEEVERVVITPQARGRIAERIVANELETHGFGVIDLNKNGNAPNVDLLAFWRGQALQIQVRSATNGPKERDWVTHGFYDEQIVDRKGPIYNRRRDGFYKADFVVLLAVRSLQKYRCFVLPVDVAEKAAQLHLNAGWKWPRGLTHLALSPGDDEKNYKLNKERKLILAHEGEKGWACLLSRAKTTAK